MVTWNNELYHYGMPRRSGRYKWGSGKNPYKHEKNRKAYISLSPSAIRARRANRKVDKSFQKWREGSAKRDTAISLGKTANEKRIQYERDKNKVTKKEYKEANKEYKSALRKNTAYRKGSVRQEVGRDMSRKYLKEAKMYGKGSTKKDRLAYNKYMVKHDKERAKARIAQEVGQARSNKKAATKRAFKIGMKTAAVIAATNLAKKGLRRAASEAWASKYNEPINTDAAFDAATRFYDFMSDKKKYFY